jgi:hypothetical protein
VSKTACPLTKALIASSGHIEFWEKIYERPSCSFGVHADRSLVCFHHAFGQSGASGQFKAKAEAVVAKLKAACESDLKTYCSNVTAGEARTVFCMLAHEDKISEGCVDAVFDVADQIDIK